MTIAIAKSFALALFVSTNIRATSVVDVEIPLRFDVQGGAIPVRIDNHASVTEMVLDSDDLLFWDDHSSEQVRLSLVSTGPDGIDILEARNKLENYRGQPRLSIHYTSTVVQKFGAVAIIKDPIDARKGKFVLGSRPESFAQSCTPGSIIGFRGKRGFHRIHLEIENQRFDSEVFVIDTEYYDAIALMPPWIVRPILSRIIELGAIGSLDGISQTRPREITWTLQDPPPIPYHIPVLQNCNSSIIEQLAPIRMISPRNPSSSLEIHPREFIRVDNETQTCALLVKPSKWNSGVNIWRIPSINMRRDKDGPEQICRVNVFRDDAVAGEGISVSAGPGSPLPHASRVTTTSLDIADAFSVPVSTSSAPSSSTMVPPVARRSLARRFLDSISRCCSR